MEAPLSPFLSLMKEKEAKENQGITEAREVAGDNHASEKSTRKTSPPSAEGLSLMKEKETKENQGGRAACQVVRVFQTRQIDLCQVACIRPNFVGGRSRLDLLLPSFLLSREEKKGPLMRERRAACQVSRVLQTKQRDLCQVTGDNHALEKSTRLTARLSAGGVFRSCRFAIPFYSLLRLSTGLALAARQF